MIKSAAKPLERLDKWIASRGTYSRREVRELVKAGKIFLNGKPATSPEIKVSVEDDVVVSGERLLSSKHVYIMLNKPSGVVCATKDDKDKTVMDLLPRELLRPGLFPAGRLDKDTEGFTLITNDGAFAHRILSPVSHVPKTYYAVVDGGITGDIAESFSQGLALGGGDVCRPASLEIIKCSAPGEAYVVICEGMYHQIKRMFKQFDLTVTYLKRISIGGLSLDPALPVGECRIMLHNEVESIC